MQSTQELFGTLSGIFTAVLIVLLTAITAWAWSARRRDAFEAAARAPLEEDPGIGRDGGQERVP